MPKKNPTGQKAAKQSTKKVNQNSETTFDQVIKDQLVDDPSLELTLPWTQVKPIYDQILRRVAKNLKIDGFRQGKIPLSVAEEKVDHQYLTQEVVRQLAPTIIPQALKSSSIKPFAEPMITITQAKPKQDWQVTAAFPQKPDIKLPADYQKFLRQHKKEALKKLQQLNAQALKDPSNQGQVLNDQQLRAKATDQALMELLTKIKPKISVGLVTRSTQRELEKLQQQLDQAQLSLDDYLRQTGMDEAILYQQCLFASLQNLQLEFILDALLTAENITVTQTDLENKLAELLPDVTDAAEKKRQLAEPTVRDYLNLMAKRQKLAHWLVEL